MSVWQLVAFLACVALAAAAQSITGFALALILLGLTGLFNLVPLPDAANVANVLSLLAACVSLRGRMRGLDPRVMFPTSQGTLLGVIMGVLLLAWLTANTLVVLRLLLGMTIGGCAVVVLLRTSRLATLSAPASFRLYGLLSGILGGLFTASGPPLVFHFYRQPLSVDAIRQALVASLAVGSALRLLLIVATGQMHRESLMLMALAAPVSVGTGMWLRRHPPKWPRETVLKLVCALLMLTGFGLMAPAVAALMGFERVQ